MASEVLRLKVLITASSDKEEVESWRSLQAAVHQS